MLQSRYVGYFEKLKNEYGSQLPLTTVLSVTSILITGIGSKLLLLLLLLLFIGVVVVELPQMPECEPQKS